MSQRLRKRYRRIFGRKWKKIKSIKFSPAAEAVNLPTLPMNNNNADFLKVAFDTLGREADAITAASKKLDGNFKKAVEIILSHKGKLMICGVGKSGLIGQKLAATLSSTGTPAVFIHAGEAAHGDLGIYEPGDPTLLISKSGATVECLRVMPVLKSFDSKLIALVGNTDSPMARQSDAVLDASVSCEADPLGIVPTSSSTLALALGDALACALMSARGFSKTDFARLHPAGQLGRNLTLKVSDLMQGLENCAVVKPCATIREAVIAMTEKPLGAACVIENGKLEGIVTDGDIRRMLKNDVEIDKTCVSNIMTKSPTIVSENAGIGDAARLMEERASKLSVLPVMDSSGNPLGLIRLHDIYQP